MLGCLHAFCVVAPPKREDEDTHANDVAGDNEDEKDT